ncbi:hypothetical protein ABVV53_08740 [Novosphingobium sp. RD2P27]|uniref:Uncharacterized protein n=1 Tax=Novosphingobium kalidii TaxID=3230299 RepID=A0ABV2D0Z0_9SPHN
MQINIFARGAQGIGPDHSINYDVDVRRLTEPLLSLTKAALVAGYLSCYTARGTQLWVPRAQLAAAVGFGHKLYDPNDPSFVPPEAVLEVPYLPNPVTADASPYQQEFLASARRMADYFSDLVGAMPPRPFDIHVHRTSTQPSPLRRLIEAHVIAAHSTDRGWWVSAAEARPLLPAGEGFDDPASEWYVDPHDWADHDEVERLITEHRRHWPEIYGTPPVDTTSE